MLQFAQTPSSGRQAGFSLVEVLLAVTLLGMILATAVGGLSASQRASASGEALIQETNQLRVVHQFVRRQLSLAQALIIEQDEDGEEPPIRFMGERDHVLFVAPMPGYLSYGGSYVQMFRIEPGRHGQDLVFYFAMLNGYESGEIEWDEGITLIENLRRGQFWFLNEDPETDEPYWQTTWEDPERLPLAVEVELDLERANGLVWPTLTASIHVDSAAEERRTIRSGADLLRPSERRR